MPAGVLRGRDLAAPSVVRFPRYCLGPSAGERDDDGGDDELYAAKADARAWAECARAPTFAAWTACASTLHNHWHKSIAGSLACARAAAERYARASPASASLPPAPTPSHGRPVACPPDCVVGDFQNALISVNDPSFFFVHAAIDCNFAEWMAASTARRRRRLGTATDQTPWREAYTAVRAALAPCLPSTPSAAESATADSSFTPFNRSWWDAHDFARALVDEVAFERAFGGANGAGSPDEPACAPSAVAAQLRLEAGTRRGRLK